ncbi:MAG: hypothetical protein WD184_05795 [Acidimicrobiia bacterium]
MRSLVVAAVLLVGLALAPEAGATGPRDLAVSGSLAAARLATGGVEDSAVHYAGVNTPQLSANQRQRLDGSDPVHQVGVT